MGEYGFLGVRNANEDERYLLYLERNQEPCLGIGVV